VGAVHVVPVDPGWQGTVAGDVGSVQPPIRPLLEQGPVEPLHLPIGLWPIWSGALMTHAGVGQRRPEEAAAVADAVVGQHAVDGDAVQGEPVMGTAPEPGAGLGPLVPQDLHIGQAGVGIDGGMQLVVAASTPVDATVDRASGPAADTMAATCRDAAELLGVRVDQVAWPWVLVAADRPTGGAVQPGQPVAAMTDQDPVDGRGREVQPGGDASWAETLTPAQPEDALFDPGRGPPRAGGGDAGPVDQSSLAELLVAGPPVVGGGPGDAHLVGDVGDRASGLDADPLDQGQSSGWVSRALAWAMRPPMSGAVR
jgi:hypothetical protein